MSPPDPPPPDASSPNEGDVVPVDAASQPLTSTSNELNANTSELVEFPDGYVQRTRKPFWYLGWRLQLVLFGVVVPIICFATAAPEGVWTGDQLWQSGSLQIYTQLLSKWPAVAVFYPLLLYSMTSMTLIAVNRERFARHFIVRFGVYTGVVLALQYLGIVFSTESIFGTALAFAIVFAISLVAYVVIYALAIVVVGVVETVGWRQSVLPLAALLLVVIVGVCIREWMYGRAVQQALAIFFGLFVMVPWVVCLVFGGPWALSAYAITSFELWNRAESSGLRFGLARLMGVVAWLAAFFAAWRVSLNIMLADYATLPTEAPGCFICTAAAQGHRRVVKSQRQQAADGKHFPANDQMRTFKAAELVLCRLTPRGHRCLRAVYNRLGPVLARHITHPLVADLAYLALKPAEWLARAMLFVLLPNRAAIVRRLYRR